MYVTVHSNNIRDIQKLETIQMPINYWIYQQIAVYPHTETYSVIKKKELLKPAATGMSLKNIMLNKRCQMQKAMYCKITFIWNAYKKKICRCRLVVDVDVDVDLD